MNQKIIILVGISGSGKTTWASNFIRNNSNYLRVNRDSIRMSITGTDSRILSSELEAVVTKVQHEQIRTFLLGGYNVIVDNTNLKKKYIDSVLNSFGHLADIEVIKIACNPDIAKLRVSVRDNIKISQTDYIENQYDSYNKLPKSGHIFYSQTNIKVSKIEGLPSCLICDLDGTLSLYGDKNAYERDFENDELNTPVCNIIQSQGLDSHIFFFSGRNGKFRDQTISFLAKNGFYPEEYTLIMRDQKDMRRDSVLKLEMFNTHIKNIYNVDFVIDDRLQVIEECWNKLGLFVLNVNQTNKRF